MKAKYIIGVWLSLVECLVRDQEAGGSNPLTPTSQEPRHAFARSRFLLLYSITHASMLVRYEHSHHLKIIRMFSSRRIVRIFLFNQPRLTAKIRPISRSLDYGIGYFIFKQTAQSSAKIATFNCRFLSNSRRYF